MFRLESFLKTSIHSLSFVSCLASEWSSWTIRGGSVTCFLTSNLNSNDTHQVREFTMYQALNVILYIYYHM